MRLKRKTYIGIVLVSVIAFILAGTFAWTNFSSQVINQWRGGANNTNDNGDNDSNGGGDNSVSIPGGTLHNDRDENNGDKHVYIENWGNEDLFVRIRLSEYMEIGPGAGYKTTSTDPDEIIRNPLNLAQPFIPGTDIDNLDTWKPHIPGVSVRICEHPIFHDYWEWTLGGQKYYFPAPLAHREDKTYVHQGSTIEITAECVNSDEVQARQTLPARVLKMSEWKQRGSQPGYYWVFDSDGWAYWAAPLEPGDATGLLINKVTLVTQPVEDYFYGINVEAQMATRDGETEDGDIDNYRSFGLPSNSGWTEDGQALMDIITGNKSQVVGSLSFKPMTLDDISTDPNTGIMYMHSQILLISYESVTFEEVSDFVEQYGGTIVGYIQIADSYQIELSIRRTLAELEEMVREVSYSNLIEFASVNMVGESSTSSQRIPNDTRWASLWEPRTSSDTNYPSGLNWGMEAINADLAWYLNPVNSIKIGVLDDMFEETHPDLTFSRVFFNPATIDNNHGTHVAGTMAADSNNREGVTGLVWNKEMYALSIEGMTEDPALARSTNFFNRKFEYAKLISEGVRVINRSYAYGVYSPAHNDYFNNGAAALSAFFTRLINRGFDFVIVIAAGNNFQDAFNANFEPRITAQPVRNRILIVGAVNNNTVTPTPTVQTPITPSPTVTTPTPGRAFTLRGTSNHGASIDIVAPGGDIDSTWHRPTLYGTTSGTSMAAPHVAGVAAMVWAINPDLTGVQVRNIVVSEASLNYGITDPITGNDFLMLDAFAAVTRATTEIGVPTDPPGSILMGRVYRERFLLPNVYVDGASVRIYAQVNDRLVCIDSDVSRSDGTYEVTLNSGINYLVVSYDDGAPYFEELNVGANWNILRNIRIPGPYNIMLGLTLDESNDAINASVNIHAKVDNVYSSDTLMSLASDENGFYLINGLEPGEYLAHFFSPERSSDIVRFTVTDTFTGDYDIVIASAILPTGNNEMAIGRLLQNNTVVANANVEVHSVGATSTLIAQVVSDADGIFVFSAPPGDYIVQAASGTSFVSIDVTVDDNTLTIIGDLELSEGESGLAGIINTEATIRLFFDHFYIKAVEYDTEPGLFSFNLRDGTYLLTAEAAGHEPYFREITVQDNRVIFENIVMEPTTTNNALLVVSSYTFSPASRIILSRSGGLGAIADVFRHRALILTPVHENDTYWLAALIDGTIYLDDDESTFRLRTGQVLHKEFWRLSQ